MTRVENIFNNKIYIGDLASITDVRCPAAKYRGEYQEVPATGYVINREWTSRPDEILIGKSVYTLYT